MNKNLYKAILAALFLALALILPFLTGQIPQIGSMLLPMHIPVLLCGFVCGWYYGAAIGFIAPLLRFVLFGMPPIMPVGLAMAFELAVYGLVCGLVFAFVKKKMGYKLNSIILTLISAMLAGRIVWGTVRFILAQMLGIQFTWSVFLAGAFVSAIPGIILQLILIPAVVLALKREIQKQEHAALQS